MVDFARGTALPFPELLYSPPQSHPGFHDLRRVPGRALIQKEPDTTVVISILPRFLDTHGSRTCAVLFLISVRSTACAPPPGDETVATSDLGNITRDDLERYILSLSDEQRRPEADQTLVDWRRSKVEDLLIAQALTDEAASLLERPAVQSAVQQARFGALVEAYIERFIDPEVDVSDEALRRYYDEHPGEFGHAEQIRLRKHLPASRRRCNAR